MFYFANCLGEADEDKKKKKGFCFREVAHSKTTHYFAHLGLFLQVTWPPK